MTDAIAIDRPHERQAAAEKIRAWHDAVDVQIEAGRPFNQRIAAIEAERTAALAALDAAAAAAYDAVPDTLRFDAGGDPVLCALTGLPVFEDDDVLESPDYDEVVLRAAVLGPRQDDDGEDYRDEDAA